MAEHFVEMLLPPLISLLELIGIFIIAVGAARAFGCYLIEIWRRRESTDFQLLLLRAMAEGLEFKMAAEILKTVLVRSMDELLMVGAVILLRGLMALMIYFEMRAEHHAAPPH